MSKLYGRLLLGALVLMVAAGIVLMAGGFRSQASVTPESRAINAAQAPDAAARLAAVNELSAGGVSSPAAVTTLSTLMRDADPQVSYKAAMALGNSNAPAARETLLTALASTDRLTRVRAAEALSVNPTPAEVPALSRILLQNDAAAAQAAKALAALDTPEARDALWTSLSDGEQTARQRAVMNALASQGEAAIPMLKQAQLSGIPALQGNATLILEHIASQ